MDPPKRVSRNLSLIGTLVDSHYKDAPGDESADRENPGKASTSTSAVKNIPESFHFFERLPLELRNRVYEFSLCRGKVFVKSTGFGDGESEIQPQGHILARPKYDLRGEWMPESTQNFQGKRRPRYIQWEEIRYDRSPKYMGLLQGVSKTVQEEAGQVFYGPKNHFVLPTGLYSYPETSGHRNTYNNQMPELPPFKSVSYTFDMRDVHQEHWFLREQVKEIDPAIGEAFKKHISGSFNVRDRMHDLGLIYLSNVWAKRCRMMRRKLALKFLQIDFEECYCPTGCCRLPLAVCKRLGPFRLGFPDKFEVIGVKNQAEAVEIQRMIAGRNKVHPSDIKCVDCSGHPLDYEAPVSGNERPIL
ncbi:MAG: hypothetical protein Q9195_004899 [Heterodermia aff. obscurata]